MIRCCCCLSSLFSTQSQPSNLIRVITLSGTLELFSPPTTAHHVITRRPTGCAVWTAGGVISAGNYLNPTDHLEPGRLYFVLPISLVFHPDSNTACLAKLVERLTGSAGRSKPVTGSGLDEPGKAGQSGVLGPPMWRPELETIPECRSNSRSSNSGSYGKLTPVRHPV